MKELRVIDFGSVAALRSQTIWHALASSAGCGAPMTLSFMRPASAYVGIGLHRSIDEVDRGYCRSEGLAVIRRQIGGGPVYLDEHQLFFQISVHRSALARSRAAAIDSLLRPLTGAFHAAGVPGELDGNGEFSLGGAKVCGHGAGEIDDGVVVVGNLIEHFDPVRASAILNTKSDWIKGKLAELMARFVGSFSAPINAAAFISAAREALASAFSAPDHDGKLSDEEVLEVERFDSLLGNEAWTEAPEFLPPAPRPMRIIKIRAGVYAVYRVEVAPHFFFASVFGRVESLVIAGLDSPGSHVQEVRDCDLTVAIEMLLERGYLGQSELNSLLNVGVLTKEMTRQWVA